MKALIITKSPKVMRPSTTPWVARHSMPTKATAMMSCWPMFKALKEFCALIRALRNLSKLSS